LKGKLMTETPRYLVNPDVSCREEGPDEGAILFNPDTDSVLVINATGLLIWRAMEKPRTRQEVVEVLMDNCIDAPADQVDADVQAFLQSLQPRGFIGEVVTSEA
jgi:Coenzyme PQQ synthesis protein D (PqqD)